MKTGSFHCESRTGGEVGLFVNATRRWGSESELAASCSAEMQEHMYRMFWSRMPQGFLGSTSIISPRVSRNPLRHSDE